jgi:hypothetical protein
MVKVKAFFTGFLFALVGIGTMPFLLVKLIVQNFMEL